jgi:hypothetical protein
MEWLFQIMLEITGAFITGNFGCSPESRQAVQPFIGPLSRQRPGEAA